MGAGAPAAPPQERRLGRTSASREGGKAMGGSLTDYLLKVSVN